MVISLLNCSNQRSKGILHQFLAAFGAALSGLCAGSSYFWVTPLLLWFTSPESQIPMTKWESSWVLNAIEIGDLVSPIPAGMVMDIVGRKPMLLLTAPTYVITWIIVLTTRSVLLLYVVRFIQGMALGIVMAVLPIYLGEIADSKIRGRIGILVQASWYAGIVYTFVAGTFLEYRGLAVASMILPIVFFILFIWLPESPYHLVQRGKEKEATKALLWLRGTNCESDISSELKEIKDFIEKDKEEKASWKDLLCTPSGRKGVVLVELVLITALMGGIVTMLTYSSVTFAELSGGSMNADMYTIIMGLLLLFFVPTIGVFLDRAGRRPVILCSLAVSFVCLVVAAIYSYMDKEMGADVKSFVWVPFLVLILYLIVMASGVEAVFPVLQGELFPSSTKAAASALVSLSLTVFSLASLVIYQVVVEIGMYLNFVIFAIFCVIGFFSLYFLLPETKGKTFAEIQEML